MSRMEKPSFDILMDPLTRHFAVIFQRIFVVLNKVYK